MRDIFTLLLHVWLARTLSPRLKPRSPLKQLKKKQLDRVAGVPRYTKVAGDSGNRVATSLYIRMEFGPAVSEPPGSSSSIVAMMQPSQAFMREDATGGYRATSAVRCSLPESEMRAVFVVVADVFGK